MSTAPGTDIEARLKAYLEAFHARDLEGCLAFFTEDAVIDFQIGIYRGAQAITQWHQDRFAADLKMLRMDSVTISGEQVVVDGQITSNRLAAWKIKSLSGRFTVCFQGDKIRSARLSTRSSNPFKLLHSEQ